MPNGDSLQLTLVVPGMLEEHAGNDLPGLSLPALERLVARADRYSEPTGYLALQFSLFSVSKPGPGRDWPSGAICRVADGGGADSHWWMHADPVQLVADPQRVFLAAGPDTLAISQDEADHMVNEFNLTFAADGWRLEAPCPQRWYLRLPSAVDVETTPLDDALGHDVRERGPHGPDRLKLSAMLTEAQMLFHSCEVNRNRNARNQPAINSLWLWGGGAVPQGVNPSWEGVMSDLCLTQGLARLAVIPCRGMVQDPSLWLAEASGRQLVVLSAPKSDEQLAAVEARWAVPLLAALRSGRMERLTLYLGGGVGYHLSRRSLRRFWRRAKPLWKAGR